MKIILPIDFSDNSKKALEFAIFLADKKNASITLVHVIELVYDFASQAAITMEILHRDAKSLMKKTIEKYTEKMNPLDLDYVKDELTDIVSQFLMQKTQKSPMVIPVLIGL